MMGFNRYILDFLIERAESREKEFGPNFPRNCEDSMAIFDELDSLNEKELIPICAIYLLGAEECSSSQKAIEQAQKIGYGAIELLTFDKQLGRVLKNGFSLYH